MKALAIDSACSTLTVAAKNGTLKASVSLETGPRQSEKLPNAIIYVLEQAELAPADLDYGVLYRGPGSFTALRLAYASLKALHLATGCPLYAIPTMEAYAFPFSFWPGAIIPVLDAKRNQFYVAVFRRGVECSSPGDLESAHILTLLDPEEPVLIVGPDAALLEEILGSINPERNISAFPTLNVADALFALAEKKIAAGEKPLEDWEGPEYIRESVTD